MYTTNRQGVQEEDRFFEKNEEQVNQIVCRAIACVFLIIPVMLLINVFGIFNFSRKVVLGISIIGSFCTLTPYFFCKVVKNQHFIKYYALICIILVVSLLGTEYYVGIYITFILAGIVSCLYFDKKLTSVIVVISYIGYLISYYFRCVQTRDIRHPEESVWETYIPLALGFTIEFIVCLLFLYKLADRTHQFLLQQKNMIAELTKRDMKLQMAINATNDILFEYDIQNDLYTANGTIRGWARKDIVIENFRQYIGQINWVERDCIDAVEKYTTMKETDESGIQTELCLSFSEGAKEYGIWAFFEINIIWNEEGLPLTVVGKIRDITEQKTAEIKAEEAKNFDALTGMYNYSSLRRILSQSGVQNVEKTHQIMIIHITNFDQIKQCYGDVYTEYVILNIAEVIKEAAQGEGVMTCRLSEAVFLVYIEDCDAVDSRMIRYQLNDKLRVLYVGEKEVNQLVYDFGYYLGEEKIDDLFTVALRYVKSEAEVLDYEKLSERENASIRGDVRYSSLTERRRRDGVILFINSLSNLMISTKDYRSGIRMALEQVGKFFELDSVRIYPMHHQEEDAAPDVIWSVLPEKEGYVLEMSQEIRDVFLANFERSRITDNTTGAFRDFFWQFGDNPLLLEGCSSLICPVVSDEVCQAIIIYDICQENYSWSDDQKEYLLKISKLIGNRWLSA
ncbi:MAG: GGDEF domain-containing protein [Clostridiaceae bacterium]|nr:GGDEF domain-containing protein [Clostridiaceae bacterium]